MYLGRRRRTEGVEGRDDCGRYGPGAVDAECGGLEALDGDAARAVGVEEGGVAAGGGAVGRLGLRGPREGEEEESS